MLGLGLALSAGSLQAQYLGPPAGLLLLGEWHLGYSQVPPALKDTATNGAQRALGVAFPFPVAPHWQVRFRYDDEVFTGSVDYTSGSLSAAARSEVQMRNVGVDALWSTTADRWRQTRPALYVGAGAGFGSTRHERRLMGYLVIPGLPPAHREETWGPVLRALVGIQVVPSLALEAQAQVSTHRFEGTQYTDARATLGVRIWPAMWFVRDASAGPS
jgi:hypothetical protein